MLDIYKPQQKRPNNKPQSSTNSFNSVVGKADAFDLPSHLCSPIISDIS
jgi:hypothetical protein